FTGEPPRRKLGDGACLIGGEHAARLGGERRVIESERVADDDACVERGCLESAPAEAARQLSPRSIDRGAREHMGLSLSERESERQSAPRHAAPSAASNSA